MKTPEYREGMEALGPGEKEKELFAFGRFAHDPQGVLTAVYRLAGMCVELFCNIQLPCWPYDPARSLKRFIAADTCAQKSAFGVVLHDPQFALRHDCSLAHLAGRA
jgi:hypothetical protein